MKKSDRRYAAARRWRLAALYLVLGAFAIPFVYPTVWMVFSAFKPNTEIFAYPPTLLPRQWTLDGVEKIFTLTPFALQYWNSLYMAVVITAATILIGALGGYAFARIRFPGANLLFLVMISSLFIPAEVTIVPIFQWVAQLGLMDSHIPLLVIYTLGPGSVVSVFIFRQFFLSLPGELEEAGRLDGLGRGGLFWRVALPLAGPAIGAVAIMKFLGAFNMYFEPLILIRDNAALPISVALTRYDTGFGVILHNTQLGATALSTLPVLIIFFLAQRQFIEGLARAGLKG